MEVIICDDYNIYKNMWRKLVLEDKPDNYIFIPVQIMENDKYFYLFDVFNTLEIIIKLDKNIKQERRFKSKLNSMKKDSSIQTAKINYDKIKDFVLGLLNVSQFDSIIKKKEEIGFEKGKEAKIKEIKDMFCVRY